MGVARMARDHLAKPLRAISDGRLEAGTRMKGPHGCMIRDTYSTQRKYEARARVTWVGLTSILGAPLAVGLLNLPAIAKAG